jgi:hypothetical protein
MRAEAGVRPRRRQPPRLGFAALALGAAALAGLPGLDGIGGIAAAQGRAPDAGSTLEQRATVSADRERVSADGRLRLRASVQPAAGGAKSTDAGSPTTLTLRVASRIASLACPAGSIFRDGFET